MYIKSLAELGAADLSLAGGKAANLGELIAHGFPVPPGFCLTTDAYRIFIAANGLQPAITGALQEVSVDDPATLDTCAARIHSLFAAGTIPAKLADALRSAYTDSRFTCVAVRSSATAEDLPGLSFAGQQETLLQVRGEEALPAAVKQCWASLWTARAIGYRLHNRVAQEELALAVVVQAMVESTVSGVLFTADPLTGQRHLTVIDAAFGLGEALVSGQVEPDHYLVDTAKACILDKRLGAKALSIRGLEGGGTATRQEQAAHEQALPDDLILELARLGKRAEGVFGCPQDMEWAWAGGKIHILQSRPVTSLYPAPAGLQPDELRAFLSFGAVQGMLDPMTPLGRETFRLMAAGLGRFFGKHHTAVTQPALGEAGERLFLNFTGLFKSGLGRKFLSFVITFGEPGSVQAIESLFNDPRLAVQRRFMKLRTFLGFLRLLTPVFFNTIANVLFPAARRGKLFAFIEDLVARVKARYTRVSGLAGCLELIEKTAAWIPGLLIRKLIPAVACGQMPLQLLRRICAELPDSERTVMELTRGVAHNVTTEMDMALWRTACAVKDDPAASRHFQETGAVQLAQEYLAGRLPAAAGAAVGRFLAQYGMRGLAEIDMGRERWQENPEPVFQSLISLMGIDDPARSPEAHFAAGARKAAEAAERLTAQLAGTPEGKKRLPVVRLFIDRIRQLAGLRELPKFTAIRIMTLHREALLAQGKKLAASGVLEKADDLFFLFMEELKAIAAGKAGAWQSLVTERRALYEREKLRRLIPRMLLSDGTCFYEGLGAADSAGSRVIKGSPVSPGIAEGIVHVVLDPHKERLAHGEILVCPGTDPSWTPLFLSAGGLVMEVGGMMTHGSVVAREYGIPAVVGVDQATTRLKTGQKIKVDGMSGVIELLS